MYIYNVLCHMDSECDVVCLTQLLCFLKSKYKHMLRFRVRVC